MKRLLYLNDSGVSECLVQNVHLTAKLQGVNYEVFLSGGDLHQTCDAEETPVGMVLQLTKQTKLLLIHKDRQDV